MSGYFLEEMASRYHEERLCEACRLRRARAVRRTRRRHLMLGWNRLRQLLRRRDMSTPAVCADCGAPLSS
jgi:hypothetical protein